ncbi:MAG: c-type cytochrome [Cognatishimia sp.]
MKTFPMVLATGLLMAGVALAHQGVKDPHIKARMHAMSMAGEASKTLGEMAKGKQAFDPQIAQQARRDLLQISTEIPALFEIEAMDLVTEATPDIWSNFAKFERQAGAMQKAVAALDTSSAQNIARGMRAVGRSCGGCHKSFRLEK